MAPSDDHECASKDLKALLLQAVPSTHIPEEKIQATVRAARAQASSRRRILGTVGATGLVLLAAATVWRWSGHDTDDLDFATALSITRGSGSYEKGRVQAAVGKVFEDVHNLLRLLQERGAVPPAMQARATDALAGGRSNSVAYSTGLEALMDKLRKGQQLSPEDEATAVAAVCTAATAFHELREDFPELAPTAKNLVKFLAEDLRQVAKPAANDR